MYLSNLNCNNLFLINFFFESKLLNVILKVLSLKLTALSFYLMISFDVVFVLLVVFLIDVYVDFVFMKVLNMWFCTYKWLSL